MPANAVKPGQEKYWERAKAQAEKQGHGKDYAYIMGIFKQMTMNKSETTEETTLGNGIAALGEYLEKAGWERGPRGGKRRRVGNKWEYYREETQKPQQQSLDFSPKKTEAPKGDAAMPEKAKRHYDAGNEAYKRGKAALESGDPKQLEAVRVQAIRVGEAAGKANSAGLSRDSKQYKQMMAAREALTSAYHKKVSSGADKKKQITQLQDRQNMLMEGINKLKNRKNPDADDKASLAAMAKEFKEVNSKLFDLMHGGPGGLKEKAAEWDKKNPQGIQSMKQKPEATITDRTPEGYGPEPSKEDSKTFIKELNEAPVTASVTYLGGHLKGTVIRKRPDGNWYYPDGSNASTDFIDKRQAEGTLSAIEKNQPFTKQEMKGMIKTDKDSNEPYDIVMDSIRAGWGGIAVQTGTREVQERLIDEGMVEVKVNPKGFDLVPTDKATGGNKKGPKGKAIKRDAGGKESLDFAQTEENAKNMTDAELKGALNDIMETLDSADALDREQGTDRGGLYRDEASVYRKEMQRREKSRNKSKKGEPHPDGYLATGPKGAGSKKLMAAGKAMRNAQDQLQYAVNTLHSSVGHRELANGIPHAEKALKAAYGKIDELRSAVEARGHDVERKRLDTIIENLDAKAKTIERARERMAEDKAKENASKKTSVKSASKSNVPGVGVAKTADGRVLAYKLGDYDNKGTITGNVVEIKGGGQFAYNVASTTYMPSVRNELGITDEQVIAVNNALLEAKGSTEKSMTRGIEALEEYMEKSQSKYLDQSEVGESETENMEKSMTTGKEILEEYLEKAGTSGGLPSHDHAKLGHSKSSAIDGGSADGGEVAGVGMTSGSGTTGGEDTGCNEPVKKDKLSEDDDEETKQMSPGKKPIESGGTKVPDSQGVAKSFAGGFSGTVPGSQREMVRHEQAQVESRLRKGEGDGVQVAHGASPYVHLSEGVADRDAAELAKSEDFYAGGSPSLARPKTTLEKSGELCKSCGDAVPMMLTACPGCGEGTVQHRPTPHETDLSKSWGSENQPLLKPAAQPKDVHYK